MHIIMTRGDKFLLAGLLLLSIFSMVALYSRFSLWRKSVHAVEAVISVRGTEVRRISLPVNSRASFSLPGRVGSSVIEVEGGRVRIKEAPCPGQVCVTQGWIEHAGQSIVCVPGEILIRIEGAAPVDAVTR